MIIQNILKETTKSERIMEVVPSMDSLSNKEKNGKHTEIRCSRSVAIPCCECNICREDENITQAEYMYTESTWRMYYRIVAARKLAAATKSYALATDDINQPLSSINDHVETYQKHELTPISNMSKKCQKSDIELSSENRRDSVHKISLDFDRSQRNSAESLYCLQIEKHKSKSTKDLEYDVELSQNENDSYPTIFPLDLDE